MAADEELIGNDFKFQVGDGASPEEFADFCGVFDVGELGEEKTLIDLTALCDDAMRYRNGLADGLEIPLQANVDPQDPQIRALYATFKGNTRVNFRLVTKGSPVDAFRFAAIVRGWRLSPPVNARAVMNFTLKITGEVTWDQSAIA